MATLNINNGNEKITTITGIVKYDPQAITLELASESSITICDEVGDEIVIPNKEIALNLIKALEKAIHLNWVK